VGTKARPRGGEAIMLVAKAVTSGLLVSCSNPIRTGPNVNLRTKWGRCLELLGYSQSNVDYKSTLLRVA